MLALSFILLQTVLFQLYHQSAKRLKESGFSELAIMHAQRHALWPALAMLIVFWDPVSARYLVEHPLLTLKFGIFILALAVFTWVNFATLHVARSLSFVKALRNAVWLPTLVVVGYYVNGDVPTLPSLVAMALLIIALFVRPENGEAKEDGVAKTHSVKLAIWIMLAFVVLQSIKDPLYREFVTQIPNVFFGIALYMTVAMALMSLFFLWKKPVIKKSERVSERGHALLATSIPALWFLGTIPEALSFKAFPVYVMISLMAVSFVMSVVSDFFHKRIRLGGRTVVFVLLILSSIAINVYSHLA